MNLKYTGSSHFRELNKSDFTRHNVEGAHIRIARHDIFPEDNREGYNTVVEVPDETGQWLLDNEAGDWAKVEDDEQSSEEKSSNKPEGEGEQSSEEKSSNESAAGGEQSTSPSSSDAPDGIGLESSSRTPGASSRASSTRA